MILSTRSASVLLPLRPEPMNIGNTCMLVSPVSIIPKNTCNQSISSRSPQNTSSRNRLNAGQSLIGSGATDVHRVQ